jgi:hypothetical protein
MKMVMMPVDKAFFAKYSSGTIGCYLKYNGISPTQGVDLLWKNLFSGNNVAEFTVVHRLFPSIIIPLFSPT